MGIEASSFKPSPEKGPREMEIDRAREELEQIKPSFLRAVQMAENAEQLKLAAKLGAIDSKQYGPLLWDEGRDGDKTGVGGRWVSLKNALEAIENVVRTGSVQGGSIPYSLLIKAESLYYDGLPKK